MTNSPLTVIGLARKAGKLTLGTEMTVNDIRSGRAKLVLTASDASSGTLNKIIKACTFHNIKLINNTASKDELGRFSGAKKEVSAIAVTDSNFAELIIAKLKSQD